MKLRDKKKKGFTLIELIVVIAIIAIIAALAIPNLGQVTANSKKKADLADAKTIASGVAALMADGKLKPATSANASQYIAGTAFEVVSSGDFPGATVTGFMNSLITPKTPGAGTNFYVLVDTNGSVTVYGGNPGSPLDEDDQKIYQAYPILQDPTNIFTK